MTKDGSLRFSKLDPQGKDAIDEGIADVDPMKLMLHSLLEYNVELPTHFRSSAARKSDVLGTTGNEGFMIKWIA